jgi:hypothetical protein
MFTKLLYITILQIRQKKKCGFPVSRPYLENLSLDVEALTKQNGVRLLGKLKKKFKKKSYNRPTGPTLPKFL